MKNKNQFLKIFAVAFIISLVTQILYAIILFARPSVPSFLIYAILTYLFNLVYFTIAPILIFAAFYFVGKNPNLTFELKSIMLALLIGNIASLFIGSILRLGVESIMDIEWGLSAYILGTFVGLMAILLPIYLLSALAGLSIGYIRWQKLTAFPEPESS